MQPQEHRTVVQKVSHKRKRVYNTEKAHLWRATIGTNSDLLDLTIGNLDGVAVVRTVLTHVSYVLASIHAYLSSNSTNFPDGSTAG